MPSNCAVRGCKSYNVKVLGKKVRFFTFPKDPDLKKIWIEACDSDKANNKNALMCSLHFTENDWHLKHRLLNTAMEKRTLAPDAVPTVKLPINFNESSRRSTPVSFSIHTVQSLARRSIQEPTPASFSIHAVQSAFEEFYQEESNEKVFELIDTIPCVGVKIKTETDIETHSTNEFQSEFSNTNSSVGVQTEINKTTHSTNESESEPTDTKTSVGVQTEVDLECAREFKIMEMEKEHKRLLKERAKMQAEIDELRVLESSVSNIFTPSQIRKLKEPNKKLNWALEDISSASTFFHAVGPRAYSFLYDKKFPLPGTSTLRHYANKKS